MTIDIKAEKRTDQGTGASRRLRRAKKVPAIVYGAGLAPETVQLDHNDIFLNLRKEAFHSSILNLDVDGQKQMVLLRDSQVHPYKAIVLHVDFQRVDPKQKLHIKVPLHFVNAEIAPGVKESGGIVSHTMTDLEIACLPADLPEFVEVDLKDLHAGHSLHVSDLNLPKGVSAGLHGEDPVVATILSVRATAEDEAADAAAAAPAAEGAAPAAPAA